MLKKCKQCGKEFETNRNLQLYCSAECRGETPKMKRCLACKKSFEPKFAGEKFCSDACRVAFWKL